MIHSKGKLPSPHGSVHDLSSKNEHWQLTRLQGEVEVLARVDHLSIC